jgi:hypothetical protein
MKKITFRVDAHLIARARLLAKAQRKTLNELFREWLEQYARESGNVQEFDALMNRLRHVDAGRRFGRNEMNER